MKYCLRAEMSTNSSIFYVILSCILTECYGMGNGLNSECEITGTTMHCKHGVIPRNVSAEITGIFLQNFDMDFVDQIQLKNVSWIQTLDIEADKGNVIPQRSFEQFLTLTYLGVHGQNLSTVHEEAFLGLDNLETLNLSYNLYLPMYQISKALNSNNRRVLPNLKTLSVAGVMSVIASSVSLNNYFFSSISNGRNLKHLDLSELNILQINFRDFEPICRSIESVNLRKSVIGNVYTTLHKNVSCSSLRTIDVSEFVIPALRIKIPFESFHFDCKVMMFYAGHIENIYAYMVLKEHSVEVNGFLFDFSPCPLVFRKIDFSGNKLKWINMTARLHETTTKTLSALNLSNNAMEYLSPSVLWPSENLERLDLSHNKLIVMQEQYRAKFEVLLMAQTRLLFLNLSYNGLTGIPKRAFSENKMLKLLDISFNRIVILDFDIIQLAYLERLIARYNRIHSVQENTQKELEFLLTMPNGNFSERSINKSQVVVYLKGNQFICKCEKNSFELVKWLHTTEVIDKFEGVTCTLSGKDVDIKQNAPQETHTFCRMQVVKKTVTISVPLAITITLFSVLILVKVKKKIKKKQQMLSVISQIKNGLFPLPHLVFLSYCSEDMDLVVNKIYPQLCDFLAKMTNSDQQLVCIGDKHFRPGFALRYEVMRCVEESSVFIAVISNNFCRKNWCNLEVGWAYDQNKPIIMLMVEHVEKKRMDNFLKKIFDKYAHASWKSDNDGGHIEPDWKILCTSIIQLAGKQGKEGMNVIHKEA